MITIDLPGYEGLYEAHNNGHIWSVARITLTGKNLYRKYGGKYLREGWTHKGKGYRTITICKEGVPHTSTAHKLIALAFHGPNMDNQEINHKDGDKSNNSPDNLEYVSRRENIDHALRTGLQDFKGNKNPNYKHGRYVR